MPTPEPASSSSPPSALVDPSALLRVLGVLEKLNASNDLGEILQLIVDSMRDCLRAERASVFQFDPANQELFITQAHGVQSIRFPITKGIAGEAARTRTIINVHDAWQDPRFNPEFDKKTGFRTKALLSIPLVSFDGGLQGVAQVLNKDKNLGPFFDQNDEIIAKALASQAAIALRRATLIEAEIRKKKIEGDLEVAKKIQQAQFPKSIPEVPGYSIHGQTIPAEETGGDTFDLIDLSTLMTAVGSSGAEPQPIGKGVMLVVGDATGHGIGPALSVAQARAMVRMGARLNAPIEHIAEHLNAQLCEDLPMGRFITAFIGLLDPATHSIRYAAPGQAPLLIVRADGSYEEFSANAMPLGVDPNLCADIVAPFVLGVGDAFLLLSDGYIEAQAPDNEQFGMERTIASILTALSGTAADIVAAVDRDVRVFVRGQPFGDDQTAVVVKRHA